MPEPQDDIDRVVGFWKNENPELDMTTKAVAMRLRHASQHLERAVRSNLGDSGVDEYWELEVLLTLRRASDHRVNAGELGRECQVTSGAITNRISRLEKRGWVRRDVDPDDRRQVLVSLTSAGLAQADHIIAMKTQAERWAFDGVDRTVLERFTQTCAPSCLPSTCSRIRSTPPPRCPSDASKSIVRNHPRGSGCLRAHAAEAEILESRATSVGALPVRRALPQRTRRTVGAWCFFDHGGPLEAHAGVGGIGPHPGGDPAGTLRLDSARGPVQDPRFAASPNRRRSTTVGAGDLTHRPVRIDHPVSGLGQIGLDVQLQANLIADNPSPCRDRNVEVHSVVPSGRTLPERRTRAWRERCGQQRQLPQTLRQA